MNESKKSQFVGTENSKSGQNNRTLEKASTRPLRQALHSGRQNCAECREEESEWEKEVSRG